MINNNLKINNKNINTSMTNKIIMLKGEEGERKH